MLLRLYDFTMLVIFVWVLHDNLLTIDAVILMILTYISSAFCICVLLWCSYMAVISNNFWCKLEVACIVLHPPVAFIFVVAEMLLYRVFFTCPITAFSFAWHIFALHVFFMLCMNVASILDVCAFMEYILLTIYEITSHLVPLFLNMCCLRQAYI